MLKLLARDAAVRVSLKFAPLLPPPALLVNAARRKAFL
jgi:hypothetical protein